MRRSVQLSLKRRCVRGLEKLSVLIRLLFITRGDLVFYTSEQRQRRMSYSRENRSMGSGFSQEITESTKKDTKHTKWVPKLCRTLCRPWEWNIEDSGWSPRREWG